MSELARALVIDYAGLGLANAESDTSLRSLDGETLVELEQVNTDGEPIEGLVVFVNGVAVETLLYDDVLFNEKLLDVIAGPLNF